MIWHYLPELPKPDTEVLAKVEGYDYCNHQILIYNGGFWMQYFPTDENNYRDAWYELDSFITVKSWAYIEEE